MNQNRKSQQYFSSWEFGQEIAQRSMQGWKGVISIVILYTSWFDTKIIAYKRHMFYTHFNLIWYTGEKKLKYTNGLTNTFFHFNPSM